MFKRFSLYSAQKLSQFTLLGRTIKSDGPSSAVLLIQLPPDFPINNRTELFSHPFFDDVCMDWNSVKFIDEFVPNISNPFKTHRKFQNSRDWEITRVMVRRRKSPREAIWGADGPIRLHYFVGLRMRNVVWWWYHEAKKARNEIGKHDTKVVCLR